MILLSNKVEFYASLPVFKAVFIAVQAQYLLAQSKTHTAGIITAASCLIVTVKHVPQIFLIFLFYALSGIENANTVARDYFA